MLKRSIKLLIGICLLMCSACTVNEQKEYLSGPLVKEDFVYEINNKSIELNNLFIADNFGEYGYYEMPSCGYDGFDKLYTYDNFEISTYPNGQKDYVLYIDLYEEAYTARGISLGSSRQELIEKYGEEYTERAGYIIYNLDDYSLLFYIEDDTVWEIEYAYGTLNDVIDVVDPILDPDYTKRLPSELNGYQLSIAPYDEELDGITSALLNEITNDEMIDEEKLKAVYDWILNNISYKSNPDHSFKDDPMGLASSAALETFATYTGNCFNYSSIGLYLINKLNIPAILVIGEGVNLQHGFSLHSWLLININDKWLHFDPCYEQLFYYQRQFFLIESDLIYDNSHRWDKEVYPS